MKYKSLLPKENLTKFQYFMNPEDAKRYPRQKKILSLAPLVCALIMIFQGDIQELWWIPIAVICMYKLPYMLLCLKHTQNCNDVVGAIPLWMNQIYALIERNTIHNAIVNSLDDHTPKAIRNDLEKFVEAIEKQPQDKQAYLHFLDRYQIDGFIDIMLKLYEFRNLSKEKLKYEIHNLNQYLGKIEALKRQNQFKNEVFIGDTCTCFIIFIPCIYMTVVSLMPSLFTV